MTIEKGDNTSTTGVNGEDNSIISTQPGAQSATTAPAEELVITNQPAWQKALECIAGCLAPWATVGGAVAASALGGIDGIPQELRPYLIQSVLSQGQTLSYALGLAAAGNTSAQDILKRLGNDTATNFGQLAVNILKAGTPEFIEFVAGLIDKKVGDKFTPDEKAALITHISNAIAQESNVTINTITGIVSGNTIATLKQWAEDSAKNAAALASDILLVGKPSFINFISNKLATEIGSTMSPDKKDFVIKYITQVVSGASEITKKHLSQVVTSNITDAVEAYMSELATNAQKTLTLASAEFRDIVTKQLVEKLGGNLSKEQITLAQQALEISFKDHVSFSPAQLSDHLNIIAATLKAQSTIATAAASSFVGSMDDAVDGANDNHGDVLPTGDAVHVDSAA